MKIIISTILFLIVNFSFAQSELNKTELNKTELLETKSFVADSFIGYDKFDYAYFVKENTIHKVKGTESLEYKNVGLGKITKIDLFNPLKVVVFYERFNSVVTLDNQLNETLKINFSQLKTPLTVSKIGIALRNQMWVFDQISQQLYLYDTSNGSLKSVGTPISEEIIFYNSDLNWFEWLDDKNNWYQCSVYGMVHKLDYQFDFDTILFCNSEYIIYKKSEKVLIFNRTTNKINALENIEKSFESLTLKNQILSIFTNQGISNYKITIP